MTASYCFICIYYIPLKVGIYEQIALTNKQRISLTRLKILYIYIYNSVRSIVCILCIRRRYYISNKYWIIIALKI